MASTGKSQFEAVSVVALKLHSETQRLEIKFVDANGMEHIVSLPSSAALELASFINEAAGFLSRLKRGRVR